jgi:hypothetical protein
MAILDNELAANKQGLTLLKLCRLGQGIVLEHIAPQRRYTFREVLPILEIWKEAVP